ncbi:MAG TPA: hypothetical protein VG122_14095, partial [Gemmata sp.]|nr:hypothetical protein [Gemmata sp.]
MYDSAPPAARDGFSFAAFMNAIWVRRWLVALVSLPIGLAAAAIAWFAFPAEYTVRTTLRCKLGRQSYLELAAPKDSNKEEIAQAQRNMLALVRSSGVLNAAATSEGVKNSPLVLSLTDSVNWLASNLRAGFNDDTEYLSLSLSGPRRPEDQAKLLNAVATSFREVVEGEAQTQRKALGDRLDSAIRLTSDKINKKRSELYVLPGGQRSRDAVDPDQQANIATIAALRVDLAKLNAELRRAKELRDQLKAELPLIALVDFGSIRVGGSPLQKSSLPPMTLEAALAQRPTILRQSKILADAEQELADRASLVIPERDKLLPSLREKIENAKIELRKIQKAETEAMTRMFRDQAVSAIVRELAQAQRNVDLLTRQVEEVNKELKSPLLIPPEVETKNLAKAELYRKELEQLEEMYKALKDKREKLHFELNTFDTQLTRGWFKLTDQVFDALKRANMPESVVMKLNSLKNKEFFQQDDFVKEISNLLKPEETAQYQNLVLKHAHPEDLETVCVLTPASAPTTPDIRGQMIRMAGAGVGAVVLVILGFGFWEMSRRRLRTREEVMARVGLRVLGTLPHVRTRASLNPARAVLGPPGRTLFGDHADGIRTLLLSGETRMSPEGVPVRSLCRVIVVTSASPAEGKSILALNLVASLVRAGKRTLLIDADLRRPSLHNSLGCDDNPGLSEVLTDVIPIGDAIQCPTPGLGFIAAGLICDEGLEALGRVDHAAFIGELLKEWDVVVLDTPPILSAPD